MGPVVPGQHPHSEPAPMEEQAAAAVASEGAGTKFTKDEANYRSAGKSPTRCVFCASYRPGYGSNSCAKVEGDIQAGDVCDLYKPAGTTPQNPSEGESITDLVGS